MSVAITVDVNNMRCQMEIFFYQTRFESNISSRTISKILSSLEVGCNQTQTKLPKCLDASLVNELGSYFKPLFSS